MELVWKKIHVLILVYVLFATVAKFGSGFLCTMTSNPLDLNNSFELCSERDSRCQQYSTGKTHKYKTQKKTPNFILPSVAKFAK